jgi:hypothetical protein
MPGVFGNQHVGDHRLGRQPTLDQPFRRWRLNHSLFAGTASISTIYATPHLECGPHRAGQVARYKVGAENRLRMIEMIKNKYIRVLKRSQILALALYKYRLNHSRAISDEVARRRIRGKFIVYKIDIKFQNSGYF